MSLAIQFSLSAERSIAGMLSFLAPVLEHPLQNPPRPPGEAARRLACLGSSSIQPGGCTGPTNQGSKARIGAYQPTSRSRGGSHRLKARGPSRGHRQIAAREKPSELNPNERTIRYKTHDPSWSTSARPILDVAELITRFAPDTLQPHTHMQQVAPCLRVDR